MKKISKLLILSLFLILLSGCGKKSEESNKVSAEQPVNEYYNVQAVNDAVFSIRSCDTRDGIVYNPSILSTSTSPLYYWTGNWTNEAGELVKYETRAVDYTVPTLISSENSYFYSDKTFLYSVKINEELVASLSLVHDGSEFETLLTGLSVPNVYNILVDKNSFEGKRDDANHTYAYKANVTFQNQNSNTFHGVLVIFETDLGQSYYLAGGNDFTDADCKALSEAFKLTENHTDILTRYDSRNITFDLGGYLVSGTFSNIFDIEPEMDSWYDQKIGFKELYSTNPYVSVSTLFGVYYIPAEAGQVTAQQFLSAYCPFVYDTSTLDSVSDIMDAEGRTWARISYNSCEITEFDRTVSYVFISGQTVFMFNLFYHSDSTIDFVSLADEAMRTITIKQGMSPAYTETSEFFKTNFDVPATPPVVETPASATTEAAPSTEAPATTEAPADTSGTTEGNAPSDEELEKISKDLTGDPVDGN